MSMPVHRYETAEGIRRHWAEMGDGDPVVLLHGISKVADRTAPTAPPSPSWDDSVGTRPILSRVGAVHETGVTPNTIFGQTGTEMNFLSEEALDECEEIASPRREEYNRWHEKLNEMAGFSVYEELLPVAREFARNAQAIDVEPRRWWHSA